MAEINAVRKLDLKLLENKIIDPEYRLDYKLVHGMLNSHVRKSGKVLTEDAFNKGDKKLRSWLMSLYKRGASQEKLTSYLRCGLAHLCYDFIESTYKQIPEEDLLSRAFSSFKLRKFHTNFFRVSKSELKPKKKKALKKKKAVKKIIKKKSPKKPVKKTITRKKTVVKKRSVKKTVKPVRIIKKIAKTIIKKPKIKKNMNAGRITGRKVIKVKIKSSSRSYKSKKTGKPRSMSSKIQSFLRKKNIIGKPSSYWKDK